MRTTTRSSAFHDERPDLDALAPPRRRLLRRGLTVAAAILAVAALGPACSPSEDAAPPGTPPKLTIPEPPEVTVPPTIALPPGYEAPDTRGVELTPITNPVDDAPPSPDVPMTGGTSRIRGLVSHRGGPVGGAVVRIERFVGDHMGRIDLAAGPDGRYEASGLPGGRYRVRSWQAPGLTTTRPVVLFLAADDGVMIVDFDLEGHNVVNLQASGSSGRWRVKQGASVSVSISQQYVDDEGVVRAGPVSGATVNAQASGGLSLGSTSTSTSGGGTAQFNVTCTEPGFHAVSISVNGQSRTVSFGECLPETDPPPEVADVPIGGGFTTERPTVVNFPPGTYVAQGPDAASCRVAFETYRNGIWISGSAGQSLTLTEPGRNMRAAGGSPACLYRRVS